VRKILREMPRETRSFEAVARKALDEDPFLQREISSQVNDALGTYLNLTGFERNAVRAVFPFYAWMRAITTITAKLPLEAPRRARRRTSCGAKPVRLIGTSDAGDGGSRWCLSRQSAWRHRHPRVALDACVDVAGEWLYMKMSSGRSAVTIRFGTSTVWLMRRSTAQLQSA
jgi:hypothetical protein